MTTFYIGLNDLLMPVQGICKGADNAVADLTPVGTTVMFSMRRVGSVIWKIDHLPANIVDAVGGVVKYQWVAGDVNTAGVYEARFTVMRPGNIPQSFPNDGYFHVIIS